MSKSFALNSYDSNPEVKQHLCRSHGDDGAVTERQCDGEEPVDRDGEEVEDGAEGGEKDSPEGEEAGGP